MIKDLKLFDTTIRDGAQAEGVSFSLQDKLKITHLLDEIGIHFIEGGWPGSNPKDTEYFERMKKEKLTRATLVAFGCTRRVKEKVQESKVLKNLIEAETEQVSIFCKGWDFHVTDALKISLEQNLDMIFDSVQYLKKHVLRVALGVEHFFDGYKANPEYTHKIIQTAIDAGATYVGAADTNGGCFPNEIGEILTDIMEKYDIDFSFHAHNDCGLALINTIRAVECGVKYIHGTINGIGERCGMADHCVLIPNLQLKMGIKLISGAQMKKLRDVAMFVAECGGFKVSKYNPYVGRNAFYHKAGVHADAVLKNPRTYNHIEPSLVGNEYTTAVSELSGRANILLLAKNYGIEVDKENEKIVELLDYVKEQENRGFQYDGAGASRYVLFKKFLTGYKSQVQVENFSFSMSKATAQDVDYDPNAISEAFIRLIIAGKPEVVTITDKKGPLNALGRAVKEGVSRHFKNVSDRIKTVDLKIRVLDYTFDGGDIHKMRVLIGTKDCDRDNTYYTVGVAHDIYSAFLKAFVDAIEYKIIKNSEKDKKD